MQQQAVGLEAPHLLDASTPIKALAQEAPVRRAPASDEPSNPIYLLAAITLGIPVLLAVPLIGMNPAIQEGMLPTIAMFLVFSAFLVAAIFEIKRLTDQPSDTDHYQRGEGGASQTA
jgi:hypothetical protein